MRFKNFVYWLLGERLGRLTVVTWNWLWGNSEPSEPEQAVSNAEQSLRTMQESVDKLTQAVEIQVQNYREAEQYYRQKVEEYQELQGKAKVYKSSGNTEQARLTMIQVVQLEKLLPQLKQNVENAEKYVTDAKEKLMREKEKLESYKTELANMQSVQKVNEALSQMAEVNNNYKIDSAKSQFEAAKEVVDNKQAEVEAFYDVSKNSSEKMDEQFEQMDMEDEVSRRLEAIDSEDTSHQNQGKNR